MGNICGKTESDPFSQPGRTLASAPPTGGTAPAPRRVGGPPRKLGGGGGEDTSADGSSSSPNDARRRAAEAAEARQKAAGKGGKLQSQLSAQKKQNRIDTLKDASTQERLTRDADDAVKTRNWD